MLDSLNRRSRKVLAGVVLMGVLAFAVKTARKTQWAAVAGAPEFRRQGNPQGAATLVEYSDFQCPSCKAAQPYIKELLKRYPEEFMVVFKHFPLNRHPFAFQASIGAECAGEQTKFWPFHDLLFERQEKWTALKSIEEVQAEFAAYAKELDLDISAFEACRRNPSTTATVKSDVAEGDARQVDSTPTFFLNRYRLVGPGQLYREGARLVEVEMRNAGRK